MDSTDAKLTESEISTEVHHQHGFDIVKDYFFKFNIVDEATYFLGKRCARHSAQSNVTPLITTCNTRVEVKLTFSTRRTLMRH